MKKRPWGLFSSTAVVVSVPGSAAGAVNARAARLRTNKQMANNFILFE